MVRGWIADLLADYAAEAEGQLDRLADLPMWNVLAADADPSHEALFVVVLLHGPSATLLTGRAAGAEVRAFGDGEFPEDPRQVIDAARARFPGALAPLVFRRGDLLAWLAGGS